MERLFYFFYQYRAFFTFMFFELMCAWLIIENNQYQGASFFNSSNNMIAGINSTSQDVREYFSLRNINNTLAEENAYLRTQLEQLKQIKTLDTKGAAVDSSVIKQYDFVSAKVVSNTVSRFTNFLTINKGSIDGITSGMAVISPLGAVGKVKTTSDHYSVVTSILHIDVKVSAILKRTGHFGSVQWDGRNPDYVKLEFIPRHVKPVVGDTVMTSGYNAVFPEGIMVGYVEEVNLKDEALFYDLKVKLSQDFRKLSFVEVVRNHLRHEHDSLEQTLQPVIK